MFSIKIKYFSFVILCCVLTEAFLSIKSSGKRIFNFGSKSSCFRNNYKNSLLLLSASNALLTIPNTTNSMKIGVLFLNLGGPEKMKDVEGFLFNLFADPDIIRLPSLLSGFQKPIAYFIAKRRAPKSSEAYQTIGGGSPIVMYTREQAKLVQEELRRKGLENAKCYFAMRYWNPYTEEVLEEIKRDNISSLVIVPLYPQYSISTSGSSLKLLQDIFYKDPYSWASDKILHTVVPAWYYRKGYISSVANLIVKEIKSIRIIGSSPKLFNHDNIISESNHKSPDFSEDTSTDKTVDILFSAHGVPQSYIAAGDPYQQQMEDCFRLVSAEVSRLMKESQPASSVADLRFHLSYQSRVGPVEWLK